MRRAMIQLIPHTSPASLSAVSPPHANYAMSRHPSAIRRATLIAAVSLAPPGRLRVTYALRFEYRVRAVCSRRAVTTHVYARDK